MDITDLVLRGLDDNPDPGAKNEAANARSILKKRIIDDTAICGQTIWYGGNPSGNSYWKEQCLKERKEYELKIKELNRKIATYEHFNQEVVIEEVKEEKRKKAKKGDQQDFVIRCFRMDGNKALRISDVRDKGFLQRFGFEFEKQFRKSITPTEQRIRSLFDTLVKKEILIKTGETYSRNGRFKLNKNYEYNI